MKTTLYLAAGLTGLLTLGLLAFACAAPSASAERASTDLIPIQNPVQGAVNRRPMKPNGVGLEENTLGVAVQAQRTAVNNQIQTEFHLESIPALPGQLYQPQPLSHAVLTLNGLVVDLNPANHWFVAFPGDLIEKSNEIDAEFYALDGSLISSLGNRVGL